MNRTLRWVTMGAAVMGMGFSMPSCPGQQALQQQVDTLEKREAELNQRIQSMDGQIRALNSDMGQVKQLLSQVSQTVLAQKDGISKLEASVQQMAAGRSQSRSLPTAKKSASKSTAKTAKKRHH